MLAATLTRGSRSGALAASKNLSLARSAVQKTATRSCGLVAAVDNVWSPSPSTTSSNAAILHDINVLRQTTSRIVHRGPDGQKLTRGSMSTGGYGKWAMGHQRLAIVDPNSRTADMPFRYDFHSSGKNMSGDSKVVNLAANGEIYNHKELYAELVNEHGWKIDRGSQSDCEVIGHAYACLGPEEAVKRLDGMFAFVVFEEGDEATGKAPRAFAARDPVGIKPLYYAKTADGCGYAFASELKSLVGHVDTSTVKQVPPGHYWTPETGLVCYYNPDWLRKDDFAPWEEGKAPSIDEVREGFNAAVSKRMMADVDYGFFLSGGVDSCIVSQVLMPRYRAETGDDRPIPAFTVGMENSPDVMAARAMVDALGGERHVDHRQRVFTPEEVFNLIPKIIFHMETYETELIRSAIPNWLLAERAGADVKMVLTGEGADELFAGYLYFMDAENPRQIQNELRRIYGMLGDINLHRTDRMTMAHALEARVPFLDTKFTEMAMSVDPALKIVDKEAVQTNSPGREKTYLRNMFEGPNENGHSIPRPVLWRAKAMQCEGVGEDWVSMLQRKVAAEVTDAEMDNAHITYPLNTPHTKEELYYRRIFEDHYAGMAHVVNAWEGGCRAGGAAWESDAYTRTGLNNVGVLSHSLQEPIAARGFSTSTNARRSFSSFARTGVSSGRRQFSSVSLAVDEAVQSATSCGFDEHEGWLTAGGDDRNLVKKETGTNKYHCAPRPIEDGQIFRGSCTCNVPTKRGYGASQVLFDKLKAASDLDEALQNVFDDQRKRIAETLDLPDGCEVIICPSGSDAEYLPIAIARVLQPETQTGRKIVNIVTQLREIGAGSAPSAAGKFFSDYAPLIGKVPDGLASLNGFHEDEVCEISIPARTPDGAVVDASAEASKLAEEALENGSYPIIHGVFGGKTGLIDAVMPGSTAGGEHSLGVVDACQGRFSLDELKGWLEQDSIVLFTASKFYQAPPFCGAVIVPKAIAEKLKNSPPPGPKDMFSETGLGAFVTDKEVPECMESWKPLLKKDNANNIGLALRWEAGLAAMEALSNTADDKRVKAVDDWAVEVRDFASAQPELDPCYVERSIVSLRLVNGDGWLNMEQLRDVYRWVSLDLSSHLPNEDIDIISTRCFIGQPVDVSESHAILRIALGADSLESYIQDRDTTIREDQITVQKLAAIARNFETLKQSGI